MTIEVDALRVIADFDYASSLSSEHWLALSRDPVWMEMAAEMPELVNPVLEKLGRLTFGRQQPGGELKIPGGNGPFQVIGKPIPRVQGFGVVSGRGKYTQHILQPGTLFLRTLGSPYPHARIRSVDSQAAERYPGVALVMHRFNLPDAYKELKLSGGPPFRYAFGEEIHEVGAPIAAVVAESDRVADEATRLIEVQYEVLPAALDFLAAMQPGAPKQWESNLDGTTINVEKPFVRGDVARGFAEADITVEATTTRSTEQHVALELSTDLAWWDNERLHMVSTTRHVHGTRGVLAQAFNLPENRVHVTQPGYLGSSYGSLRTADLPELHAALAARLTGRPVRYMATRAEDFTVRTHRGRMHNEARMGFRRDGSITAAQFKIIADVGAARSTAASGSFIGLQSTYAIPNLRLEGVDVLTNRYKTNSFRCVSHPNGTFASEILLEKAAYQLGLSPLDIRLKNINTVGNPDTKKPFSNPGLAECLTRAAQAIDFQAKWHAPKAREVRPGVYHGIGLAAHSCSHGAGGNPATGMVVLNLDGTVNVVSGAAEVGPGERTLMAMIAAETLGIPFNKVSIAYDVDSDISPDTGVTAGSRQTNSGGWGVHQAALDARAQLMSWAARKFVADARARRQTIDVKPEQLELVGERQEIQFIDDPSRGSRLKLTEVVAFSTAPIIGRGAVPYDTTWERLAFASHAAEIELDSVTGSVKVLTYVAAHDVGRALNPFAVSQQIEGGVIMGLGAALTESMLTDTGTGVPLNPNLLDYRALSILDVPKTIDVIMVERPKEYGVYGAHGIGEPPIALAGSVISNAIYNAVGVWMTDLPMNRARILAALRSA